VLKGFLLLAAVICCFTESSFADVYGIINRSASPKRVRVARSTSYNIDYIDSNRCVINKLANFGRVGNDVVTIDPAMGILLESTYNHIAGGWPAISIDGELYPLDVWPKSVQNIGDFCVSQDDSSSFQERDSGDYNDLVTMSDMVIEINNK
jgi:hypothetical protein